MFLITEDTIIDYGNRCFEFYTNHEATFYFLILFIYLFIYLFLAVLGLRFCARAFSSCGKWGPLFIAVRGPLTIVASLVAEHRLQTRRLSNCGSRTQLLCGMWDLPRPGLEPVSPALAGRFSTTAPPGKPMKPLLISCKTVIRNVRGNFKMPLYKFIFKIKLGLYIKVIFTKN